MLFSKACQYAILAMTYLAQQEASRLVAIREIGEQAGIPTPFLGKIISTLSRAQIISARRGPHGGAMLARRPEQVIVGDIVAAIDGTFSQQRCILGLPQCSDGNPCPLHGHWRHLAVRLDEELHRLSLADLAGITLRNSTPEQQN